MLCETDRQILLDQALESLRWGLTHGRALSAKPSEYSDDLQALRASFVTLKTDGKLRGCIGTLEARRALILDVVENAYAAGFRDTRFAPFAEAELPLVKLSISILTPATLMDFDSEANLLSQLRPGKDGLILTCGKKRSTFLPTVWDNLSVPKDFLTHLKLKAGLAPEFWSEEIRVERYQTESIS